MDSRHASAAIAWGVVLFGAAGMAFCPAAESPPNFDYFEQRIRPMLADHCYACHGPDESSAGLRLDSRDGWQKGGDSGPVIVPGDPAASLAIRAVRYTDPELRMPPDDGGGKLTDDEIDAFTTWVRMGAPDPRVKSTASPPAAESHWAFQPVRRPAVPSSEHPIDYLIEQKLVARQLVPTPAADHRTLVRRAVYDLHGLPPTPEQLAVPVDEWGLLVDALLDSPRYGERWGRHWLDVARYADAKDGVLMYGDQRIRPFAYTYRDYVIRSFNEDRPFDRFIHEQLAADQLDLPPDAPQLAALGFLTLGRMFDSNRHDVIDDQIDAVTRGLLGLTVSCARCHNHKFDPIPTTDYYALYGVFASCEQPFERPRIEPISAAGEDFESQLAAKLAAIREMEAEQHRLLIDAARSQTPDYLERVATTTPDVSETAIFFLSLRPEDLRPQIVTRWRQFMARRAHPDDPLFAPWHDMLREPKLQLDRWRERGVDERVLAALGEARPTTAAEMARTYGELLVRAFAESSSTGDDPLRDVLAATESPAWFPTRQAWYYMSRQAKDKYGGMVNDLDALAVASPHAAARAMALVDADSMYEPVVFRRGDPTQPGEPVPRRFVSVLSPTPPAAFGHGSGRVDLARAITDRNNPLTARVLVNRVWMHHFGEPLVENPSDFGVRTPQPEHLELLDFLASELLAGGWRLKPLHRLIMSSAAYQRSSRIPDEAPFAQQHVDDPENRWLWRGRRRRLDLESMRDTLLQISGRLDLEMYGRPRPIDDPENCRRTVYALVERQNIPGVVRDFDFASPDATAARRNVTTVPQQALFAMNSEFVARNAQALADRVRDESPSQRIVELYRRVLARDPTPDELGLGADYLRDAPWVQYVQVLLMTNELMFVD